MVPEGNQTSEGEARSGIGAQRWDFWIIRDNPLGRILVKKATYGVRQEECETGGQHHSRGSDWDSWNQRSALQVCHKSKVLRRLSHRKASRGDLKERKPLLVGYFMLQVQAIAKLLDHGRFRVKSLTHKSICDEGKWWHFTGNWLDWLEASQRWTKRELWNICSGAVLFSAIKDIPSSSRKQGVRLRLRDGQDGRPGSEREDERRTPYSKEMKMALPVQYLFRTSVWVLSVHTTTASLLVSHQGHNSLLQILTPFHPLMFFSHQHRT